MTRVIPGRHTVQFKRRGHTKATTRIKVRRGETAQWFPKAHRHGDLRVSNRGRRGVTIFAHGLGKRWVDGGESLMIPGLKTGEYRVAVTDHRGRTRSHSVRIHKRSESHLQVGGRRLRVSQNKSYNWAVAQR